MPAGSLHEMKFEDLEAEPVETLRRTYAALNLPGIRSFRGESPRVPRHAQKLYKNVLHLSEPDRQKVRERWSRYIRALRVPVVNDRVVIARGDLPRCSGGLAALMHSCHGLLPERLHAEFLLEVKNF